MNAVSQFIKRQPQRGLAVALVVYALLVGTIDYFIVSNISLATVYLVGIGIAAWYISGRFAIFLSFLSTLAWVAGDVAGGELYTNTLTPVWNAMLRLIFYLSFVWALTNLRVLQQELEERVRQRTEALVQENQARQRMERDLLEISEREQRRIGQDLHDSLAQHLTGTAFAAQVLREKLAARDLPESLAAEELVELIEDGIALSRKLARGLQPVDMQEGGLMDALQSFADSTSDLFKVSCHFECEGPIVLTDSVVAANLYRIAQEAVGNAIKHGGARNIHIGLEANEDGWVLYVRDDGAGLPDPVPNNGGMGLKIMSHRAKVIGASFKVVRTLPGTVVTCHLKSLGEPKGIYHA